jgi:hypothetical protein
MAAGVEKAVEARVVAKLPDDLPRVVDAEAYVTLAPGVEFGEGVSGRIAAELGASRRPTTTVAARAVVTARISHSSLFVIGRKGATEQR